LYLGFVILVDKFGSSSDSALVTLGEGRWFKSSP